LFFKSIKDRMQSKNKAAYRGEFPAGLPNNSSIQYLLRDSMEWIREQVAVMPEPFLGYFHMLPPHTPYTPSKEFNYEFIDSWNTPAKPGHVLSYSRPQTELNNYRRKYDQYIANVDDEFGKLVKYLEDSGTLENTWLVFTSDHGEMFERGIWGHLTSTLFEPIIHIPLMIRAPGQHTRVDINTPSSAVDILPTLLHVTGHPPADWSEGAVLPPYNKAYNSQRPVYVVEAKHNAKHGRLQETTVAMIRGENKVVYYLGYPQLNDRHEFYALADDPNELRQLAMVGGYRPTGDVMVEELKARLAKQNDNYP
ncbi:MAG: sulfatase-like hydrolase/transferase, partial [Chloroflexota bacterium]